MSHEGHVSISINAFCNFIGSANIPAGGMKTWHKLPDIFFPSPSLVLLHAWEKYGWFARPGQGPARGDAGRGRLGHAAL